MIFEFSLKRWHSTNEWQSARTLLICQDLWKISQSSVWRMDSLERKWGMSQLGISSLHCTSIGAQFMHLLKYVLKYVLPNHATFLELPSHMFSQIKRVVVTSLIFWQVLLSLIKLSKLLSHPCFCYYLVERLFSQIGSISERTKMNGHRHEKWRALKSIMTWHDSKECKTQPIFKITHFLLTRFIIWLVRLLFLFSVIMGFSNNKKEANEYKLQINEKNQVGSDL